MASNYLQNVLDTLHKASNPENAASQRAYMKNQFDFLGIGSSERKKLLSPFLSKKALPEKSETISLVRKLWNLPEREFQYFAQELLGKYHLQFDREDIELMEFMALHKSWWDTIDYIASNLMGPYFKKFPDQIEPYIHKWLHSDHIWLQRCCLLFQLKYKDLLDTGLLKDMIGYLTPSNEFFINKAIGWILREYSKTNPEWVLNFIENNPLSNLSKREGLKVINRNTP